MPRPFLLVTVLVIGLLVGYLLPHIGSGEASPTWQFPRARYDQCLAKARGQFATLRTIGPPEGKALLILSVNTDCARLAGIDAVGTSEVRRYTGLKCCLNYLEGYDKGLPNRARPK